MCVVSMVGDFYHDKWTTTPGSRLYPALPSSPILPSPINPSVITQPEITKSEFDDLKREVLEMKELLKRAIKYDKDNNEPDCHIDEKMELLRKVADMVGISLDDVIGTPKKKVLLTEQKGLS